MTQSSDGDDELGAVEDLDRGLFAIAGADEALLGDGDFRLAFGMTLSKCSTTPPMENPDC